MPELPDIDGIEEGNEEEELPSPVKRDQKDRRGSTKDAKKPEKKEAKSKGKSLVETSIPEVVFDGTGTTKSPLNLLTP
jgi:hypothetical protein